jgi:hypothetical protein
MSVYANRGEAAGTYWNPAQYLKFTDHRLRPALELLDRVPLAAPRVIYDLGCLGQCHAPDREPLARRDGIWHGQFTGNARQSSL